MGNTITPHIDGYYYDSDWLLSFRLNAGDALEFAFYIYDLKFRYFDCPNYRDSQALKSVKIDCAVKEITHT